MVIILTFLAFNLLISREILLPLFLPAVVALFGWPVVLLLSDPLPLAHWDLDPDATENLIPV